MPKAKKDTRSHGRSLWSGALSFGLINIPVSVRSAKEEDRLSFTMLDKRDHARIGYQTFNKRTGKEISRDQIVKGYEYEKNKFVVLSDKDFEEANPKAVHTIDIEDFVDMADVDPLFFEKPYYLVPSKGGEKGYVLIHQILHKTRKVAVAKIVMHNKQHLAAIMARGEHLVLEVMRYAREVLSADELGGEDARLKTVKISKREVEMAEQLVRSMTVKWDPEKYEDTYTADIQKMIQSKIKKGGTVETDESSDSSSYEAPSRGGKVLDLMPLLKKSLAESGQGSARKRASARSATRAERAPLPTRARRASLGRARRASH